MGEEMVSLENWVDEYYLEADASEKSLLYVFQKEWQNNHLVNPLLFPLAMTRADWRENLDWFITVENFVVPSQCAPESEGTTDGSAEEECIPESVEEGGTVIYELDESDEVERTVIYEKTVIEPQEDPRRVSRRENDVPVDDDENDWSDGDLDDLGTLIAESGFEQKFQRDDREARNTGEVLVDGPASDFDDAGTMMMDGPASDFDDAGTVMMDGPASDFDDAGTVMMDGPASDFDDAGTVMMDGPASDFDDAGTVMMDGPASDFDDAGTVMMDGPASDFDDAGTVMMDGPASDFDDAGTVMMDGPASDFDDAGTVMMDGPASDFDDAGTVMMDGPASDFDDVGTVMMDGPAAEPGDARDPGLDLDDLGALIMERNKEVEVHERNSGPSSDESSARVSSHGDDDLGNLIMSRGRAPAGGDVASGKPLKTGGVDLELTTPASQGISGKAGKPDRRSGGGRKTSPANTIEDSGMKEVRKSSSGESSQGLELDLDDLESMTWLDE